MSAHVPEQNQAALIRHLTRQVDHLQEQLNGANRIIAAIARQQGRIELSYLDLAYHSPAVGGVEVCDDPAQMRWVIRPRD